MASSFSPAPPAAPFEPEKRIAARGKEPSRRKTHWDYVLQEMAWLAKDFESERKMKLSQAKRMAVKVCKSGLSAESKGQRRQKEEEQRMRRLASNIAKDVKKFWTKIEKLIMYKHQMVLEGIKKKALDKHLDFLVGQTERYSTMIAEIWMDTTTEELQPPNASEDVQDGSHKNHAVSSAHEEDLNFKEKPQVHNTDERRGSLVAAGSQEVMSNTQTFDSNGDTQVHDQSKDLKQLDKAEGKTASYSISRKEVSHKNGGDSVHVQMGKNEEDQEFSPENMEDVEDDFTTLEADEALITEEERNEELLALEREGSLPLEELLKMYSSRRG